MRKLCFTVCVSLFTLLISAANVACAGLYRDALALTADGVMTNQIVTGASQGAWTGETGFVGTMLVGMVRSYEITGDSAYLDSAELSAQYIKTKNSTKLQGDEVYGLCLLGELQADPLNNQWTSTVVDYFNLVRTSTGGVAGYLAGYQNKESSTAVYYLSHMAISAYKLNVAEKVMYKNALIENLVRVDDDAYYPVLALEVATWALAVTGSLDNSYLPAGTVIWAGLKISDLPEQVACHQVDGSEYGGAFYWRFDHTGGLSPAFGFTEELVYGILALSAVQAYSPAWNFTSELAAARPLLTECVTIVDEKARVYENIWVPTIYKNYYAAELIQAMAALWIKGDANDDGGVDLLDYAIVAANWQAGGCTSALWCQGADLNMDSNVNFSDLEILASSWMCSYKLQ